MILQLPLTEEEILSLRAGDIVYLTGIIYTARDAAHERLVNLLKNNQPLPISLKNGVIYYVGPTPTKPGCVIGSAGPTSSYRMDSFVEPLLEKGLKIMIGKGPRSDEVKKLLVKYQGIYLSAIGGAGASIAKSVKKCNLMAYEDLGPEAIYRLTIENFYAVVTYDTLGNDLFEDGIKKYQITN